MSKLYEHIFCDGTCGEQQKLEELCTACKQEWWDWYSDSTKSDDNDWCN